LIDIQSKLAEARQTVGHRSRGIFGQSSLNEVSLPLGAQFQAVKDGLQEPSPDFLEFGSGALFTEPEGKVIIIHLVRNIGLHHEEKMTQAEMEIQVMVG
jgi:hypothetical protein